MAPFVIGFVAGPVTLKLVKPVVRGVIRTSVAIAMEVKKVAAQAGEELQDLAAEVTAEMAVAQPEKAAPAKPPVKAKPAGTAR
ncbi:DUF5132 domain-containing protein [Amycolatopsis alba DSM 44262]|uniref:DUF5132 domain-containing protein n=1 Tax=Amycolatopsis alba DSM 44262 TaxID=1125972 RepID=A0A229S742_AMYAL|nr:DUF5132 domain-containing protein [Amycolatopsis alba DSM 44262]